MHKKTRFALATTTLAAALAGCGGVGDILPTPQPVAVGDTVVLTAAGRLVSFNRATPGTSVGSIAVSGLTSGDTLVGIDYRPADGLLYALSSGGRIYTVDPSTGVATVKSTLQATAGDDNPYTALVGTDFGVDFNPTVDRLRVVSNSGQNLRINVDTGATITDGNLSGSAISAAAYTNAFAGASGTQLRDIDAAAGQLLLQDPPNNGTLGGGVALGISNASTVNGFDIDARNNVGYAALAVGGAVSLYRIDLAASSAAATSLGPIAGGESTVGLALRQPAAATVIGLTTDSRLVSFDPRTPNTVTANVAISGLAAAETVLGIDFRPSDGRLYALANTGRLYTVDAASGVATLKATLVADTTDSTAPFTGLRGNSFSVDFNPAADRLRVLSDTGQSLRINPDATATMPAGATITDGDVNRASGAATVVAAAYTNSFAGTTTTTLFDFDANSDVLARQDPPNNGTLVDIGALGIDARAGAVAFDIAGGGNAAYAAFRAGAAGPFSLYTVSLSTGAATLIGNTGGNAALSQIGGATGPTLLDIAVRL